MRCSDLRNEQVGWMRVLNYVYIYFKVGEVTSRILWDVCFVFLVWWTHASQVETYTAWKLSILAFRCAYRIWCILGSWPGKHLFTNHKIVLKASCSYLSRHRSRMHNMQDGQIRETCHVEFRTIPGRGCDSRARQVYKAKGDGVTVRPSLFRNAYKLSLIYINSAQGRQFYMQTVVSCVFLRAMRCK